MSGLQVHGGGHIGAWARQGGEMKRVIVDDRLPLKDDNTPAFATSKDKRELWVSILEKAYAKFYGSYEAIEGGFVHIGLMNFTGGSGKKI